MGSREGRGVEPDSEFDGGLVDAWRVERDWRVERRCCWFVRCWGARRSVLVMGILKDIVFHVLLEEDRAASWNVIIDSSLCLEAKSGEAYARVVAKLSSVLCSTKHNSRHLLMS